MNTLPPPPPLKLPTMHAATLHAGEVAIIGAGPGEPGLLTLRAWLLLQQADALVYDRLVDAAIVELVPAHCQRHYVGKRRSQHTLSQSEINQLLIDLARQHLRVVRLKGGDAFVFGRGGEEIEQLLAHGISCQVVPGITAATGCLAYAGVPLTHRTLAHSCQFITGHLREGHDLQLNWPALAAPDQTLVFYMGLSNAAHIAQQLQKSGLSPQTPAMLISQGAGENQRIHRMILADMENTSAFENLKIAESSPTLIVIGRVVGLFKNARLQYPARLHPACQTPDTSFMAF